MQCEFIKLNGHRDFLLKGKYSGLSVKRLIFGARIAPAIFLFEPSPFPPRFFIVFSYISLCEREVIVVARHALPVIAFRHSIKRASAHWRCERTRGFIVEILIRSLSISFATILCAGDFQAKARPRFRDFDNHETKQITLIREKKQSLKLERESLIPLPRDSRFSSSSLVSRQRCRTLY